jgi:catechol 2,3-dioxygenase-like lactoylglutathione lyase family enzyme
VVIMADDLEAAIGDYTDMGFTVVSGGEHADGLTHNALIASADGSYLELIAFKGEPPETHFFYRPHGGEGLRAFALVPEDIEATIAAARERGLSIEGPLPGGRVRPDGVRVEWQLGRPSTRDLPFLCADVTPRELRVPGGSATQHANRIEGIVRIDVLVADLDASVERYRALLGTEPTTDQAHVRSWMFTVGGTGIELIGPSEGTSRLLAAVGEGPIAIRLNSQVGPRAGSGTEITIGTSI